MKLTKFGYDNLFALGKGEISLKGRGLMLISGHSEDEGSSNGAGKSSLANKGILWTMYGRTAGGLKADSAINIHGSKSTCTGKLEFEGVGGEFRITRKRPSKLLLEKKSGKKWVHVEAHTSKETQKLIDSAFGMNYDTFVQTSVFGQGRKVQYPELSAAEKKEVLEGILPMEQADAWAELSRAEAQKLEPGLDKTLMAVNELGASVRTLGVVGERIEGDIARFGVRNAGEIAQFKSELQEAKERFIPKFKRAEILKEGIDENFDEDAARSEIAEKELEIQAVVEQRNGAETSRSEALHSSQTWRAARDTAIGQQRSLTRQISCPTCERDFDDSTVGTINARVEGLKVQEAEALANHEQATDAWKHYNAEWGALANKEAELRSEVKLLEGLSLRKANYANAIKTIEFEEKNYTQGAQSRLDAAKSAINPHIEILERHNNELVVEVCSLGEAKAAHIVLREEHSHLHHWERIYGRELKLKLFETACPFLDSRAAHHLAKLNNSQITVKFTTIRRLASGGTKEEFATQISSSTGGASYESLSGGEQQIVSFACALALSDLAARTASSQSSFLILDEPFGELSPKNAESVVNYLSRDVGKTYDTIFLISNEESLSGLVPNRIKVVKKGGISNVE